MTQDRQALLDELGFSWEVRPSLERPRATWYQRLDELRFFHKEHGNFKMNVSDWPQLLSWCHEQRQRLRLLEKNDGKDLSKRMGPERVKALQDLGFDKDTELPEQSKAARSMANVVTVSENETMVETAQDTEDSTTAQIETNGTGSVAKEVLPAPVPEQESATLEV